MEAAHFFEGTEKLLEVWFSRQQPDANQGSGDLRTIPRLKTVNIKYGTYLVVQWIRICLPMEGTRVWSTCLIAEKRLSHNY
uniref:Adenosylmethionine decarboxylase 1 n=1 Tax=Ovis aries TaxID=9940 RepID=A0AC11DE57_SHEEP